MVHQPILNRLKSSWRVLLLILTVLLLLNATIAPASAAPEAQDGTYTVQSGDTLSIISRKTGTSVSDLINLNGATYPSLFSNPNLIYVGWVLKLSPGATVPGGSGGATYTVKAGDYLAKIARETGTSYADLINLNGATYPTLYTNPNVIHVGWVLKLSAGATVPDNTTPPDTGSTGDTGSAPPPTNSALSGGFELGGQTHSLAHPGEMHYAGMSWVKYQIKWTPGADYGSEAGRLDSGHAQGFKVLFSVTGPDHPSSIDYGAYAGYVGGLAAMGADGIEVWNEMNFDREWVPSQISGSNYVNNMLRPAYNAIKANNPGTLVISGAPTPTGAFPYCGADIGIVGCNDDTYLHQMAAAGGANYADCIGMHYNAGTTSPYATSGSPNSYHYSWYYTPMVNLYYGAFGGARKLCITELGYLVGEGTNLPGGFSWASGTSVAEHAQWLAENVSLASSSGKVRLLIVWNVDIGDSSGGDPQGGYSIIRSGGCPACDTLHNVTGGT
jgi:LysM repeat protein